MNKLARDGKPRPHLPTNGNPSPRVEIYGELHWHSQKRMKTWLNSWNRDQRRKKLLERGIRLHAEFESDAALEIAYRLIEEQDPAGYELAAQVHLDDRQPTEARDLLIPALDLFPANWQLTTKLAQAQADLGFYPEAQLCLESLADHPEASEFALTDLARLHLKFQRPEIALLALAKLPETLLVTEEADRLSLLALAHFRAGNLSSARSLNDEAIARYHNLTQDTPSVERTNAHALAAIFAIQDERFRLASQCITEADELIPDLELTLLARRMKNSALLETGTYFKVLAEGRYKQAHPKEILGFSTSLTIFTTSENLLLPIANERLPDNESIVAITEILSATPGTNDYEGLVALDPSRTFFELKDEL